MIDSIYYQNGKNFHISIGQQNTKMMLCTTPLINCWQVVARNSSAQAHLSKLLVTFTTLPLRRIFFNTTAPSREFSIFYLLNSLGVINQPINDGHHVIRSTFRASLALMLTHIGHWFVLTAGLEKYATNTSILTTQILKHRKNILTTFFVKICFPIGSDD